jgi:DNA-binding response OmpR family regulator
MNDGRPASASPPTVLVIEDDPDIREVLRLQLTDGRYRVRTAADGLQGLAILREETVALVVLDIGLPQLDGLEVCRALTGMTPRPRILMLTARSSELDRARGLDLGADDYLVKPFGTLEFAARVRALLRRPSHIGDDVGGDGEARSVTAGALHVDRWERCAWLRGQRIELTAREFELLHWLAQYPQRVFSRSELLDVVWGQAFQGFEHTVNSHINRLRGKIEVDPSRPQVIVTVRGGGYMLVPPRVSGEAPVGAADPRSPA